MCGAQSSGVDVNRTMSGWLRQRGYPVLRVRVARDASGKARALELQQDRFGLWVSDPPELAANTSAVAPSTCAPPECQPPDK